MTILLGVGLRAAHVDGLHHDRADVDTVEGERQFALGDARHVQKIVDEPRFDLDVALDHGEQIADVGSELFVDLQCRYAGKNGAQGRA